MATTDQTKIIAKIAKPFFKPYGVERKGQSRIYLDDHGWYIIVVEFQPRSGGNGTLLNVGVNFNWYRQEYFSFDIGYRENPFVDFRNEAQFTSEVEKLCYLALERIQLYRQALPDIEQARQTILTYQFTSDELWGNYHRGTIEGLTGNFGSMNNYYNALLQFEHNVPWVAELKARVNYLKTLSGDKERFRTEILSTIVETRQLKKLKEQEIGW